MYHCFSTPFQAVDLFGTTSQNMRELRLQIGKARPEPGREDRWKGTNQIRFYDDSGLAVPPKCQAHQISILDGKAQLISKFLVTQVSCGAVDRKLMSTLPSYMLVVDNAISGLGVASALLRRSDAESLQQAAMYCQVIPGRQCRVPVSVSKNLDRFSASCEIVPYGTAFKKTTEYFRQFITRNRHVRRR